MRNKLFILSAIGLLYSSFLIYSCKKDDNNDIPSTADWIAVDQGSEWISSVRSAYYTEDQGTRSIPYSWITSLKDPSGAFFLSGNLQRYGFLPISGRKLPVGFNLGRDTANILSTGFTCSGCHTRQIEVGDKKYRIDGAPALTNLEAYTRDLGAALTATVNDPVELEQFLDRVIAASSSNGDPAITDRNALRNKVISYEQHNTLWNQLTIPTPDMWGVGRSDALNQIFNRVAGIDLSPYPDSMLVSNIAPADKPVRFPFLWNAHIQDYTQWAATAVNGNTNQALVRNNSECLGVGAQFRPVPDASMPDGFNYLSTNSINFSGLQAIEGYIKKIGPPKWPWPVNQNLVSQGANLFAANCASCHGIQPGEPRPPAAFTWSTGAYDVQTDSSYYATLGRTADPGILSPLFPASSPIGVISKTVSEKILIQYDPTITFISPSPRPSGALFESRVLQGIWAAAPYLHNGSVPTLEDLLMPSSQRPTTFYVGPKYDTDKVGLSATQVFSPGYLYNTSLPNNSNSGHEYGTQLSPQDRAALLEYLKTL